jgi:hypothetical protein
MNAARFKLIRPRLCILALGVLAVLALPGCAGAGGRQGALDEADACGPAADCDDPATLASQIRLDTDAILAGMAHARARLGLQEDATP